MDRPAAGFTRYERPSSSCSSVQPESLEASLRVMRLAAGAPSWEARPAGVEPPARVVSKRHYEVHPATPHGAPHADAAGLLTNERHHGKAYAQRHHAQPLPPPPQRLPSPRRGLRPTHHVFGSRVVVGEAVDALAEAAGLAHWRTGGRYPGLRRPAAEQARPATANPMDMTPVHAPIQRAQRGRGAPMEDMLAHAATRQHQVWPPGRPSVVEPPWDVQRGGPTDAPPTQQRKLRAHLARGVPGAGADSVGDTLAYRAPPQPQPEPRPCKLAMATLSRGNDYARNRARINATSADMLAPPLYEARPGTAPARGAHFFDASAESGGPAAVAFFRGRERMAQRPAWV